MKVNGESGNCSAVVKNFYRNVNQRKKTSEHVKPDNHNTSVC